MTDHQYDAAGGRPFVQFGFDRAEAGGDQNAVCLRHGDESLPIGEPYATAIIELIDRADNAASQLKALADLKAMLRPLIEARAKASSDTFPVHSRSGFTMAGLNSDSEDFYVLAANTMQQIADHLAMKDGQADGVKGDA